METSNTEGKRIVKFLLLTILVQYFLERLRPSLTRAILFSGSPQVDLWLTVLAYAYPLMIVAVCTLVNRSFTFRSSKNWFIAVLLMMLATFLWNILRSTVIADAGSWADLLWLAISYLLQRCVIYRGTLDTNGWYDRSQSTHEANDERVTPDE